MLRRYTSTYTVHARKTVPTLALRSLRAKSQRVSVDKVKVELQQMTFVLPFLLLTAAAVTVRRCSCILRLLCRRCYTWVILYQRVTHMHEMPSVKKIHRCSVSRL